MKYLRNLSLKVFLCFILWNSPGLLFTQILDSENKLTVTLSDDTPVTLYGKAVSLSDEKSNEYYYLPCNLRLSKKKDGTPQFLFLKYTSEETEAQGGVEGAILHMLMEYGLTEKQEEDLQQIISAEQKGAKVLGVANVEADGDNSVRVISATLTNKKMTQSLILSGKAPVLPGSKIALAADLDKNGAQLFAATLENVKSITDLSITLSFNYDVRFPAARGYIIEDWSKMDSLNLIDSTYYSKSDKRTTGEYVDHYADKTVNAIVGAVIGGPIGAAIGWLVGGNKKKNHFTYDEMHQLYQELEEQGIIEMRFEENLEDERLKQVRDAFFQHFLNSFTEKDANMPPIPPGDKEKRDMPNTKIGDSYKFRREFAESIVEKRKRVFNLNYSMAVKRSFQLTENLASWYEGVKDNKNCIGVVNLNDPFFEHRDINVILDLDAEDMMGKEMNYVTVNLRKKRSGDSAHDFSHQLTFDRTFFEENGNRQTVTYSKAQDSIPDMYEYKVQWSLRGGNIFPKDTSWTKGNWQGLTLAPPVQSVPIRFEVDLDELKELNIRNATLQLRYLKFGREVETNCNISLYKKEPYLEKTIYMDKNTQGYAYRLVFTHQRKGVLAMPWEAKINTSYVFAVVPDELREGDESFIEKALEEGKKALSQYGDGKEVKKGQEALDKFKDILITN
jgi:hypothetical protein